jgi:hypothetical protein
MSIEVIIGSLILGFLTIIGPFINTLKIYKINISDNIYAYMQRIFIFSQFLFTILAIASISYQLIVKRQSYYQSNTYIDLVTYFISLMFTILNLIYFKYFIIDYEVYKLTANSK